MINFYDLCIHQRYARWFCVCLCIHMNTIGYKTLTSSFVNFTDTSLSIFCIPDMRPWNIKFIFEARSLSDTFPGLNSSWEIHEQLIFLSDTYMHCYIQLQFQFLFFFIFLCGKNVNVTENSYSDKKLNIAKETLKGFKYMMFAVLQSADHNKCSYFFYSHKNID